MKYIGLPDNKQRRLSFYLSMEEYIARYKDEEEAFFMWKVKPSVIFGRNQLIQNEINLDYTKKEGIELYRRKSGGGCVYVDLSTVFMSYITKDFNVGFTFNKYLDKLSCILQELGVNAHSSGRNDITIEDKKISGNAFYRAGNKSIVHGTILFDTNLENLVLSITPSNEKLISKGIESVKKRVTNLSNYLDLDIDTFKDYIRTHLCDDEYILDEKEITIIEEIEKEYLNHDFIFGNNPRYTLIKKGYANGVGEIEIHLEIKNKIIKDINLVGDYFLIGDIDKGLLQPLINTVYDRESIESVINQIEISDYILNLTKERFMELII